MKQSSTSLVSLCGIVVCLPVLVHAQGLFEKAGDQAEKAVAVFEQIWDDFYGKFDELIVAEADKEHLEFDANNGLARFVINLTVNQVAHKKWLENSRKILSAVGIKEVEKGRLTPGIIPIGGVCFEFGKNSEADIDRASHAGEMTIPRMGVVVELVEADGSLVSYAALPLGVFSTASTERDNWSAEAWALPLSYLLRDAMSAKVAFAGITKESLDAVDDIRCRVLLDPVFTKECRLLALKKINADGKVFTKHGIKTATILLPGDVPLSINETPKGIWFGRYEVTQDQWGAIMGSNPSVERRKRFGRERNVDSPDMPVDCISWAEANSFVQKLNALPEVKKAGFIFSIPRGRFYHRNHRRDPESHWNHGEPEWEYGCVGSNAYGASAMQDQGIWFGLDLEGNKMDLDETAWVTEREKGGYVETEFGGQFTSRFFLHPVGMKRPNAFGLYDMLGNAGEIVEGGSGYKKIVKASCKGYSYGHVDVDFTCCSDSFDLSSDNAGGETRGLRLVARRHESKTELADTAAKTRVQEGDSHKKRRRQETEPVKGQEQP